MLGDDVMAVALIDSARPSLSHRRGNSYRPPTHRAGSSVSCGRNTGRGTAV